MKRHDGSILLISLIMLLVLTIVGIASISGVSMSGKMANSQKDYELAFEMAEAALVEGESWIDTYDKAYSRSHLQSSCSGSNCWKSSCDNGLCFNGTYPLGTGAYCDLTAPDQDVWTVEANWTSKARSYSMSVSGVDAPKYLIEFMCFAPRNPKTDPIPKIDYTNFVRIYRVTAMGFGTSPSTRVMLQSTYRGL